MTISYEFGKMQCIIDNICRKVFSSTYTGQKSEYLLKILSILLWKIYGTFFYTIRTTFHMYCPCEVLDVVNGFTDSLSLM